MTKNMRLLPVLAAVAALSFLPLTGCSKDTPPPITAIRFTQPPLVLDVADIQVTSAYPPRMAAPNVDHLMNPSPTEAVRLWAQDRLRSGGTNGRILVTVKDASVIERFLPKNHDLRGAFTRDQEREYVGHLVVDVSAEQRDPATGAPRYTAFAQADVARVTSLTEGLEDAERIAIRQNLLAKMMQDLNGQLDAAIRQNMQKILLSR
jgi:hypothetical protein